MKGMDKMYSNLKNNIKYLLYEGSIAIGAIILIIGILYGAFIIKKSFNYSTAYKSMVIQTIKETVKEEALR